MRMEHALLVAARGAGVPVPEVVDADESSLILEHVDGETIPRRILRDDTYAPARQVLAAEAGAALAAVHRLDPTDLADAVPANDEFDQYRSTLHSLADPYPVLEFAFRRLGATRPPQSTRGVVHGDFRMGNLIVGPEGLRAVLDWELAHLGDPLEDLGWFCVRAWRFGSELPAGGVGSYDAFVGAYEEASGCEVDRDALRWWEAFGTLRWGVICAVQASLHLSGAIRSVELAAIGRRVCEVEWDLLGYLR
jgi:aminoglycoside phosphotransferase (APT) family kinase protein